MPFTVAQAVSSTPHKRGLDSELRSDEVPPLIPRRIPRDRQRELVQEHFGLAAAIAIDGIAVEELDLPKRRAEAAVATLGQERQYLPGKERVAIRREVAGGKKRSEATVGKQRGSIRVDKQSLVAGSKFGIREKIESTFDHLYLLLLCALSLQFKH